MNISMYEGNTMKVFVEFIWIRFMKTEKVIQKVAIEKTTRSLMKKNHAR